MKRATVSRRPQITVKTADSPGKVLRAFVHDITNSLAAIRYSTSVLAASTVLAQREKTSVQQLEKAAALIAQSIENLYANRHFADGFQQQYPQPAGETKTDLYLLCCGLAGRRQTDRRTISCRAYGDPRGRWDRHQVARVVSQMLDQMLAHLDGRAQVAMAVTGLPRHVRLDLYGVGLLSPRGEQACLEFATKMYKTLNGTLTATVSPKAGSVLTLRLPR